MVLLHLDANKFFLQKGDGVAGVTVLRMQTPRKAVPSFSNHLKHFTIMAKMKCPCKYTYDPEKGDPKQGIPPGTQFEDLPDTWRCPRCKRKKEKFVPVEE